MQDGRQITKSDESLSAGGFLIRLFPVRNWSVPLYHRLFGRVDNRMDIKKKLQEVSDETDVV